MRLLLLHPGGLGELTVSVLPVQVEIDGDVLHQPAALPVQREPGIEISPHQTGPGEEATPGSEVRVAAAHRGPHAESVAVPVHPREPEWRRRRGSTSARPAAGHLEQRAVDLPEHQPAIHSAHAIVVTAVDSVGIDQSHAGTPDSPLEPENVVDRVILARGGHLPLIHG